MLARHCENIGSCKITGCQSKKPVTLPSTFRVKAALKTTLGSDSVLDIRRFPVHLCNSSSVQICGGVSGLHYSIAHQIVPTKVAIMTGAEKIIGKVIITLLSLLYNMNSKKTKTHAITHAPAVYLSTSHTSILSPCE
jgi:hypothetical protein